MKDKKKYENHVIGFKRFKKKNCNKILKIQIEKQHVLKIIEMMIDFIKLN